MENGDPAVLGSRLSKTYVLSDTKVEVLKEANLSVERGELAVVSGASGSGKTTLLNIIGGIDKPSSGEIVVLGEDLGAKDEDFLATFRCNNIGFVFQSYNLISTLTVAENIAFPMEWLKKTTDYIEKRVQELLAITDLEARAEHFPFQLSGGEQQRVAFARALANNPPLLLVDEPTGNLDKRTSTKIIDILHLQNDDGKTLIVATHDEAIVKLADRRLRLEEGKLVDMDE